MAAYLKERWVGKKKWNLVPIVSSESVAQYSNLLRELIADGISDCSINGVWPLLHRLPFHDGYLKPHWHCILEKMTEKPQAKSAAELGDEATIT